MGSNPRGLSRRFYGTLPLAESPPLTSTYAFAPAMTRSIARLEKAGLHLRSLDPALRSNRADVSQVPPQS